MFNSFTKPCEVIDMLFEVSDGALFNMDVDICIFIGALTDVVVGTLTGAMMNVAPIVLEFVVTPW